LDVVLLDSSLSAKTPWQTIFVIPAKAGIQVPKDFLDRGFCRGDGLNGLVGHVLKASLTAEVHRTLGRLSA
jgi:hypothetical protein